MISVETYPVLKLSSQLDQLVFRTNHEFLLALEGDPHFEIDMKRTAEQFEESVAQLMNLEINDEINGILADYSIYVEMAISVGRMVIANPESGQKEVELLTARSKAISNRIALFHNQKEKAFMKAISEISRTTHSFKNIFGLQGLLLFSAFLILGAIVLNILMSIKSLVHSSHRIATGELAHSISIDRKDEIGFLQSAFEKMRSTLKDHIESLDEKIQERTQDLNITQKELKDILNTVEEGIFTFNLDMSLNAERSQKLSILLGENAVHAKTIVDLFLLSKAQQSDFEHWLKIMASSMGLHQWNKYSKLCPISDLTLNIADQALYLKMRYQPIYENGQLVKIMALALDITGQREAEKILNISRQEQAWEMERVIGLVSVGHNDADLFLFKLDQALALHKSWRSDTSDITTLMQALHTLRGNCGSFGFNHLAELLMQCENELEQFKDFDKTHGHPSWVWVDLEKEKLKLFHLRNLIYQGDVGTISIDEKNLSELLSDLRNKKLTSAKILERIETLDSHRFIVFARRYEKMIESLKTGLNKNIQPLMILNRDHLVSRTLFQKVDPILVHLLRNAIFHGIESDSERKLLGKGNGEITLKVFDEHRFTIFEVSDDGKGIDLAAIRKKCINLGIISEDTSQVMTDEALIEKIFEPGFSSREDVSAEGGRGIGLSVVRQETEKLGGQIKLSYEFHKGCTFRLDIPKSP